MSLLQDAIADSKALKDASYQAALQGLHEKYSEDIKRAVDEILEQEDDPAVGDLFDMDSSDDGSDPALIDPEDMEAGSVGVVAIEVADEISDVVPLAAIGDVDGDEEIEINFDDLEAALASDIGDPEPIEREEVYSDEMSLDGLDDDIKEALVSLLEGELASDDSVVSAGGFHETYEAYWELYRGLPEFSSASDCEVTNAVARSLFDEFHNKSVKTQGEDLIADPEIQQAASDVGGEDVNNLFHQWLVAWGSDNESDAVEYGSRLYHATKDGATPAVWHKVPQMKSAFEDWLRGNLQEEITVDIEPGKTTGWLGKTDHDVAHRDAVLATKAAAEKAVNETLGVVISRYDKTIESLKESTEKLLLENSILIYSNKALSSVSLNERQKTKFVEAIAKAETVREAQVIFETVRNAVSTRRVEKKNALIEAVERPSTFTYKKPIVEKQDGNPVFDRMKKLAGLNKK